MSPKKGYFDEALAKQISQVAEKVGFMHYMSLVQFVIYALYCSMGDLVAQEVVHVTESPVKAIAAPAPIVPTNLSEEEQLVCNILQSTGIQCWYRFFPH